MQESLHRLFLACPVPEDAGQALVDWAQSALDPELVRFTKACDLHVTLAFYPAVSDQKLDRLASLTRQVAWEPLEVEVGKLVPKGRSALALDLLASEEALRILDARLVLSSCRSADAILYSRLGEEPLGQLSLAQGEAEWERRRRRHRSGQPLAIHATLARTHRGVTVNTSHLNLLKIAFLLGRLVLYESVLGPDGPEYTQLAEANEPKVTEG